MAEQLSKALGRPVIVDNKAGAQGRIAGQAVAALFACFEPRAASLPKLASR